MELIVRKHIKNNTTASKADTDMFYHIKDGRHAYDMSTTRDLTPNETEDLFDALDP